jgi:hypothetical protein
MVPKGRRSLVFVCEDVQLHYIMQSACFDCEVAEILLGL